MNKKGQEALLFLMTYGWTIVIVLCCIGALAYFGVLDACKLGINCDQDNSAPIIQEINCSVTKDTTTIILHDDAQPYNVVLNYLDCTPMADSVLYCVRGD